MNNQRRKQIAIAVTLLEKANEIFDAMRDEEQEAMDNLPESMQYAGERWDAMEEARDKLDNVHSEIEYHVEELADLVTGDVKTDDLIVAVS